MRLTWAAALSVCAVLGAPATGNEEATTPGFDGWLAELRREALSREIGAETLDAALAGVRPIDRVLELDRNQPEFTLTVDDYLERYVTRSRIDRGRRELARNRELLEQIRRRYGVQPRFVVALWGVESNYGRTRGSFAVVDALATLAFDGRRSAFFRGELLDALQILDEGHVEPPGLRGSWAGATGQTQFMPSSFLRFAVDHDGDGRRDIWNTTGDVLASVANYLAGHGWHADQTWGRRVRLPRDLDPSLIGRRVRRTLPEWQALGVRRANGAALPTRPLRASIVQPDAGGPAYLVYDNYRTVLRWNNSERFGIAVGVLSDRLARR